MLYLATMTFNDDTFQSIAASAHAAKSAIQRGWVAHLVRYARIDPAKYDDAWFDRHFKTLEQLEKTGDIKVVALVMNDCVVNGATLLVH